MEGTHRSPEVVTLNNCLANVRNKKSCPASARGRVVSNSDAVPLGMGKLAFDGVPVPALFVQ